MSSDKDQRVFPRIAAGTSVGFAPLATDRTSRRYLESIADNVSLGGMFLASRTTFRPGTLLQLQFVVPETRPEDAVRTRAIVRWRRWWWNPRGMGVQFVEFEGLGRQQLDQWLARLLPADGR